MAAPGLLGLRLIVTVDCARKPGHATIRNALHIKIQERMYCFIFNSSVDNIFSRFLHQSLENAVGEWPSCSIFLLPLVRPEMCVFLTSLCHLRNYCAYSGWRAALFPG